MYVYSCNLLEMYLSVSGFKFYFRHCAVILVDQAVHPSGSITR